MRRKFVFMEKSSRSREQTSDIRCTDFCWTASRLKFVALDGVWSPSNPHRLGLTSMKAERSHLAAPQGRSHRPCSCICRTSPLRSESAPGCPSGCSSTWLKAAQLGHHPELAHVAVEAHVLLSIIEVSVQKPHPLRPSEEMTLVFHQKQEMRCNIPGQS